MKYISVFVPTFNGEKYICELIQSVLAQEIPKGYKLELLITDSGSSDHTVDIIRSFGNCIRFNEIPNSDFGHGKTRQDAAEAARGEYILFLTQDATPQNNRWLINMIEPFFISERVGCVFGRQVPRPAAVPTIKREVSHVFAGLGSPDSISLQREKSLVDGKRQNALNSFFSDVNSAIRKDLVLKIPFRSVKYAEDQALAVDMQDAGYLKAYSPQGSVWHSNEYTPMEYRQRKFDEYIGLQESIGYPLYPSVRSLLFGWIKPTLSDWMYIKSDREYGRYLKLKYFFLCVFYNIANTRGRYDAAKHSKNSVKRNKLSLEANRKR